MKEKFKIFLGGYVNFPNAQNVNCDNIAKYLDKNKFEVHTMYTSKMPIDKEAYRKQNIHLHKLIHHRHIWYWSKWFTMKLGDYDIYYLPKAESVDKKFALMHRDKLFLGSVEGVVGEQISSNDKETTDYYNKVLNDYFSISNCIRESVQHFWKRNTKVLYLGVNESNASMRIRMRMNTIIWVGSVIKRKRPEWFLECAKAFPSLQFIMIGDGDKQDEIMNTIDNEKLCNVLYLGRIPNGQVYSELEKADLLLMTSDKEGLPKVIGEAMICGVPTIYINECYNVDYIDDGINGFAVQDLPHMIEKIQFLLDNPKVYQKMSKLAYQTIQQYTWKNLIKDYEDYFIEQYVKFNENGEFR